MPAAEAPSKALPRSPTSVSLSGEEIQLIADAAHKQRVPRAEFIRNAAIDAARAVLAAA